MTDVEQTIGERLALARTPGGRADRRTASGRQVEFNFKQFADGSLLVVCRDITELKRVEESLRAAGDVLRVISQPTFNLQAVLDTLVVSAARLCEADKAFVFSLEQSTYRVSSNYGFSREYLDYMQAAANSPRAEHACRPNRGGSQNRPHSRCPRRPGIHLARGRRSSAAIARCWASLCCARKSRSVSWG